MNEYSELLHNAWLADKAYYADDDPILSDGEYDQLIQQIKAWEEKHPDEIDPNSPTQRVSGWATTLFTRCEHPCQMQSLQNVFTDDELVDVLGKPVADAGDKATYIVEPKLDGLTLVCHYNHGVLQQAVTRGDGFVGEDVTPNARTISCLPLTVPSRVEFYARGEVMITKAGFAALNERRAAEGLPLFANPRNAAAGSLRQKDPQVTAERHLCVWFYDLIGVPVETELAKLNWMLKQGLPTVRRISLFAYTLPEAAKYCHWFDQVREKSAVELDGAVVKVMELDIQQELGVGTKYPHWAVAFKFPAASVSTRLLDVSWQVGRTGQVTPVAVMEPVSIGGTMVDHASLHNVKYVESMNLRINDVVSVYKAAEIIPQVASVIRTENGAPVEIPIDCPECGHTLTRREQPDGSASLYCTNETCRARCLAALEYFCSRDRMDIKGFGPAVVSVLYDTQNCRTPADLYTLDYAALQDCDGFGQKKVAALKEEIEKSKGMPLERVLAAIGLPYVGGRVAEVLAEHYQTMDALMHAPVSETAELEGIGGQTASAIHGALHKDATIELIEKLRSAGLQMQAMQHATGVLSGDVICITGTLSRPRSWYAQEIEKAGGKFTNTLTKTTTKLIVGTGGGGKQAKADKLGIAILTEEQFLTLIGG